MIRTMTTENRYHPVSQWLHWIIAGLIVLQFILAQLAEGAEDAGSAIRQLALLANHKSVGITILMLVIEQFDQVTIEEISKAHHLKFRQCHKDIYYKNTLSQIY